MDTDSVFLEDLTLGYQLLVGSINLGASNLFNKSYRNVTAAAGGYLPSLAER